MVDLRTYRNLHSIALIRHCVRSWWNLELAFADARGYVLDHADGKVVPSGNEFCRLALFSKEGFRRCNDSVKLVRSQLGRRQGSSRSRAKSRPPVEVNRSLIVHECHLGFDIVAAPIHLDGELAGFLFAGGSYHAEPGAAARTDLLRKVREFSTPDADAFERHVSEVPRMTERERRFLGDLLLYGARQVVAYHAELASRRPGDPADREVGQRFTEIVGESPAMLDVYRLLDKIVRSEATVLIHGESGTGKELIARAIHYHGPRAKQPFVVQNCSAFNDNLLESALFGHVRGAFTGAIKDQKGLFEVADGGTFFLDEIGDMSPALQVKLLRVLQEGTLTPVGATKPVRVDVRIIAASHKDLTTMVERNQFREDLYYRINVLKISVPPLRDRIEDLPVLAEHFLRKHHHGEGEPPRLSRRTFEALQKYAWPGNIRELENEIERLLVLSTGQTEIGADLLSPRIREAIDNPLTEVAERAVQHAGTLREVVERVEAEVIGQGLIRTHWNKSQLAKELGISRSNLIQKCNYYGLDRKE